MKKSVCFSQPVAEVHPVCCTVNARWKEMFLVMVCGVFVCGDARAHRNLFLTSGVSLRVQRWVYLWPECPIIPLLAGEKWEKNQLKLFVLNLESTNVHELFSGERAPGTTAENRIKKQDKANHTKAASAVPSWVISECVQSIGVNVNDLCHRYQVRVAQKARGILLDSQQPLHSDFNLLYLFTSDTNGYTMSVIPSAIGFLNII